MSRKLNVVLAGLSVACVMLFSGCSQTADLSLQFAPEDVTAYTVSTEVIKDFRFEQPNLGKLREEQTKTAITMDYSQKTAGIDENGVATIEITINGLSVDMVNKNEQKYAYDSENPKDKNSPMGKLLGKTYTYQITKDGNVTNVDVTDAKNAIRSGYERKIADSLLDEKAVTERHQIMALPEDESESIAVETSWSQLVPSPPGLLSPKTFEKSYTLSAVETRDGANVATVSMVAAESADTLKGADLAAGGMGMFAKMFDNEDDFTGTMIFDLDAGKVLSLEETLISTYIAQEMPENGDPEKGPDTLTMRFTNRIKLQKQD